MIFTETVLEGAFIIEPERIVDERGFFARSWCQREFKEHGLEENVLQCNISYNKKRGTLRGMHYQMPPFAETKLVRCTRGALYDVIVDLRPDSKTFLKWIAEKLTADNLKMLYVPKGFAHGFQTLEDDTEVFYQMSQIYAPEYSHGVRWDDPLFSIVWPDAERTISSKDQQYKNADPSQFH
jgi:dTDP-4-dehydrorhamnose 3,5-epimerase